MTVIEFRPPWQSKQLADLAGIPVIVDSDVPAGTAVLDVDPDEPRHITRIRIHHQSAIKVNGVNGQVEFPALTEHQREQVRDHYRAMDERAGRLLAEWRAMERFAAAAVPDPPHPPYLITGV